MKRCTKQALSAVRVLVFDLDGTLIDSRADITGSVNFALQALGLPTHTLETVTGFVGRGVGNLIRAALDSKADSHFDKAMKLFKGHYREHCLDATRLFPGVRETLSALVKYKKAVVTNKPKVFTERILKGLEIAAFFEAVVSGDEVIRKKPAPDALELILKKFHADAEQTLVIGDSPLDLQMARATGARACAVSYGYGIPSELAKEKPDFTIDTFQALLKLISP